jgi:hypothetical protein
MIRALLNLWAAVAQIWRDAPYCSGDCGQSDRPCNCETGRR